MSPCCSTPPRIDLIVTDVDGTLLNSKQELNPRVEKAVKTASALGVPVSAALLIVKVPTGQTCAQMLCLRRRHGCPYAEGVIVTYHVMCMSCSQYGGPSP